jgi:threonine dehydratase
LDLKNIRDAEKRISGQILKTPLVVSTHLSEKTSSSFFLKLENLQVTNSFKIRGAMNKLAYITSLPSNKVNTIITASAGNHGQAIALCASKVGLHAKIVVPETTPKIKTDKIRQYGAELIIYGSIYDEAEQYARGLSKKEGLTFVSPYNDELIIAGQGTVALEVLSQSPETDIIMAPIGGGGLISGVSIAAKAIKPDIEIIGVQSEASPTMYESLLAKRLVESKVEDSIAEGLSGNLEPNSITFDYAMKYVDRMLLVKEDSIRKAIRLLWENDGQVVEGSGAVPVAAILENTGSFAGKKVVAIISGGNIDFELFKSIVESD